MEKSKQIILISLLPLLLAFIFIFQILVPKFFIFSQIKEELETKKEEVKTLKSNLDTSEQNQKLLAEVDLLEQKIAGFNINFPQKQELEILLIDLDRFAVKNKVNIEGLNARPEVKIEIIDPTAVKTDKTQSSSIRTGKTKEKVSPVKLLEIPLEIKVSGAYTNLVNFISNVENYGRIIKTDGVELREPLEKEAKNSSNIKMTIHCKVYRAVEEELTSLSSDKSLGINNEVKS